jgi:hypothetical protein
MVTSSVTSTVGLEYNQEYSDSGRDKLCHGICLLRHSQHSAQESKASCQDSGRSPSVHNLSKLVGPASKS